MNISDIKHATRYTSPYFFSRDTLKFFGQTVKSFKVKTVNRRVFIYAPSYWDGKLMGYTFREIVGENIRHIRNEQGGIVRFETLSDITEFLNGLEE